MKLELGKRYITRGGRTTSPLTAHLSTAYPFTGTIKQPSNFDQPYTWSSDGIWTVEGTCNDIVAEYRDAESGNDLVAEYAEPSGSVMGGAEAVYRATVPTENGHYETEGNKIYAIQPDGSRLLIFDDAGAAGLPKPVSKVDSKWACGEKSSYYEMGDDENMYLVTRERVWPDAPKKAEAHLPARLEIASRLMGALYVASSGPSEEDAVAQALSGADALIKAYIESEP